MIAKCNLLGTPVVTATQMLESMCKAPRPTRAEAGDVANAVLDGTDCVMLSGETAGGAFPLEAVSIMRRIVEEAEQNLDYITMNKDIRLSVLAAQGCMKESEAMSSTCVKTALDVCAPMIMVMSATGKSVLEIAKYRPKAVILAITDDEYTRRQLLTSRGVISFLDKEMSGERGNRTQAEASFKRGLDFAKRIGVAGLEPGAPVVTYCQVGKERQMKVIKV